MMSIAIEQREESVMCNRVWLLGVPCNYILFITRVFIHFVQSRNYKIDNFAGLGHIYAMLKFLPSCIDSQAEWTKLLPTLQSTIILMLHISQKTCTVQNESQFVK